jgi:glycosyltransferase involved in cell wall biosynthesis
VSSSGRPPGVVSVIIPAFNAERWIADTIASVRDQTHPAAEVIVSDDGSTDATVAIASAAADRVTQGNGGGPGGARNAGMRVARGEFLQFLDADDLLAPDKLARQVAVLSSSGADVAWEAYHYLLPGSGPNEGFVVGQRVAPDLGPDLEASLLTARGFVQIGALLIRRSPRTNAIRFAEGREVVEDVRYMVELAMAGARFVSSESEEPGLLFRQHTGARYSTRPAASFARGCAANADWARAYWEREGPLTPARRAALSEAYAFAARQLALTDSGAFHRVASRGMSLGPDFLRHLPARLRWLSKLVGYERAESLAVRWRRARLMWSEPGVERQ